MESTTRPQPTHALVDSVIKGLLLRKLLRKEGPPSVSNALSVALEGASWQKTSAEKVGCVDLGLDLLNRPGWIADNDGVWYLGLRAAAADAPEVNQHRGRVRVVSHDWRSTESLRSHAESLQSLEWFLMVDSLDHVEEPGTLLDALSDCFRHDEDKMAHVLVVTRNIEFFGKDPSQWKIEQKPVKLRTRREMRRHFRDAGLHVLDELSPPAVDTPELRASLTDEQRKALDLGIAPLHYWVLLIHRAKKVAVTAGQVDDWMKELSAAAEHSGRAESTELLLHSIKDRLEGVHWKSVSPGFPLVTIGNTAGRLFVVKDGTFGAFNAELTPTPGPIASAAATPINAHLSRSTNDLIGEWELFDERDHGDRLYMTSLYAMDRDARALVIPAHTVSRMSSDGQVLDHPLLRDLRSKTLKAELGARRASFRSSESDIEFDGRWASRKVLRAFVEQTAVLLEMAMEHDRSAGLVAGDGHHLLVFSNFQQARYCQFGTNSSKGYNPQTNAALQYLEACGAIRLLCLRSMDNAASKDGIRGEGSNKDAAKAGAHHKMSATESGWKNFFDKLGRDTVERAIKMGLQGRLNALHPIGDGPGGGWTMFRKNIIDSARYVAVWVESQALLRRFSMELSPALIEESRFRLGMFKKLSDAQFKLWDEKLADELVDHFLLRSTSRASRVDSIGMPLFAWYTDPSRKLKQ